MKILILSMSDSTGGAALAAMRLHKSLLKHDLESLLMVQKKNSDYFTIIESTPRHFKFFIKIRPILDSFFLRFYRKRSKTLFSSSQVPSLSLIKKINELKPDIVHLHWICGGMLRIEDLAKIKAPLVWTFHDMWPFTGGCHYTEGCNNYKMQCGKCKVLGSNKSTDLSQYNFRRKLKSYGKIKDLTIVCSSKWMKRCTEESSLFKNQKINLLKNCIDTDLFRPVNKEIARNFFKIPTKKNVVLFSAMNSLSDTRKGAKELFEAINMVSVSNTIFVISGSSRPPSISKFKYPVYFIHPLKDEEALALMYNVANVMVVPSLQENLANSISESLSCGVPVVAFNIGGNPDMIEHKSNGYLAKEMDCEDLSKGINWSLENENNIQLSINARNKMLNEFDSKVVSRDHIKLYEKLV